MHGAPQVTDATFELKCPPSSLHGCAATLVLAMSSASKTSGAAQSAYPKGYLPLSELTPRNAKFGKIRLAVFHPWEEHYEYVFEGSTKKACCFKTLLVDDVDVLPCGVQKTKKNEKPL